MQAKNYFQTILENLATALFEGLYNNPVFWKPLGSVGSEAEYVAMTTLVSNI
jgi:hypothetical protein